MSDITVAELFDETALSDDPVFVAYREDRPTEIVAENGVEITESNVQFAFFEPGEIGVLTAHSDVEGDLSAIMDRVCRHFGVTDVVFINVLGETLAKKLHGFERTRRTIGGHEMDCLEGEWQVELPGRSA